MSLVPPQLPLSQRRVLAVLQPQVRRRIREGAGPVVDPPRSIVAIGRVGWII